MPTKFKLFDVRKVPSAEPARVGKYDQLIMYEIDPMRRYIVRMNDEDFNEDAMIKAIAADMAERDKFVGKEYEIP